MLTDGRTYGRKVKTPKQFYIQKPKRDMLVERSKLLITDRSNAVVLMWFFVACFYVSYDIVVVVLFMYMQIVG